MLPSIGIIGGADGPTAIYVTTKLAPGLLGPIAIAAYSYMALVPVIQPPIMKALTSKKDRQIVMGQLRTVSKTEKIVFPIVVTVLVSLMLPSAAPLIGALMLGNLFKESGVTERLSKTAQNELMNIVTIFLGVTVGATAKAETFLQPQTLKIIAMGVFAFGGGTAGGVLLGDLMCKLSGGTVNPLPLNRVRREEGDLLVAVDVSARFGADSVRRANASLNYYKVLIASSQIMQQRITQLMCRLYKPDIMVGLPADSYGMFEFYRSEEILEAGRAATRAALERLETDGENGMVFAESEEKIATARILKNSKVVTQLHTDLRGRRNI